MQTIGGEEVALAVVQRRQTMEKALAESASWKLPQWLNYLDAINPEHMSLGLDRVRAVAARLHIFDDIQTLCPAVVTVAGTNGKGSTAALTAQVMSNLGKTTGLYTSPHLVSFTERIKINGSEISEDILCAALHEVVRAQFPDSQIDPIFENSVCYQCGEDDEPTTTAAAAAVAAAGCAAETVAAASAEVEDQETFDNMSMLNMMDMDSVSSQSYNEAMKARDALAGQVVDLTYFEIITLAAMRAFLYSECEVIVLEVGLGGRLDAVNIFDNDLAIITSIGLDHMKILGDTTAKIAAEKAGIIRPYGTVIVGANMDDSARKTIMQAAKRNSAHMLLEGQYFNCSLVPVPNAALAPDAAGADLAAGTAAAASELYYEQKDSLFEHYFRCPRVPLSCAGMALSAVFYLSDVLGFDKESYQVLKAIDDALATTQLPGRMSLVHKDPAVYLDVAHNVPAAQHLKNALIPQLIPGSRRKVVIGMLKDKDIEGVLKVLKDDFVHFYLASLHTLRGETHTRLYEALTNMGVPADRISCFDQVSDALNAALKDTRADTADAGAVAASAADAAAAAADVIIVMGSFVTVAEAHQALSQLQ